MAVKLKSAFKRVSRPVIFACLLFIIWWLQFNFVAVIVFLLGNFLLYIYPLINSLSFISSFLVLITISFISLFLLSSSPWYVSAAILVLTILYYLALELKNMYLIDKKKFYYLLNLSQFYILLGIFFIKADSYFSFKIIALMIAVFFLFREFLKINTNNISFENNVLAAVITLLLGQLAWITSWLSISFIMATNLLFLFVYIIETYLELRNSHKRRLR